MAVQLCGWWALWLFLQKDAALQAASQEKVQALRRHWGVEIFFADHQTAECCPPVHILLILEGLTLAIGVVGVVTEQHPLLAKGIVQDRKLWWGPDWRRDPRLLCVKVLVMVYAKGNGVLRGLGVERPPPEDASGAFHLPRREAERHQQVFPATKLLLRALVGPEVLALKDVGLHRSRFRAPWDRAWGTGPEEGLEGSRRDRRGHGTSY